MPFASKTWAPDDIKSTRLQSAADKACGRVSGAASAGFGMCGHLSHEVGFPELWIFGGRKPIKKPSIRLAWPFGQGVAGVA
jgi:hypothetical protein